MGQKSTQSLAALVLLWCGAAALAFLLRWHSVDPAQFEPRRSNHVSVDLLEQAAHALVLRETREIRFGEPASLAHYDEPDPREHLAASGFMTQTFADGSSRALAVGERARVRFVAFGSTTRTVTLEAAGLDEQPQDVTVHLNGRPEPIARFRLQRFDLSERVTFTLPGSDLADGDNELEFRFARTQVRSVQGSPFRMPWAATFVRMQFDGAGPAPSLRSGDITVASVPGVAGDPARRALVIEQGARVVMPVRLPNGAPRLVASLFVHPEDGAAGRTLPLLARLRGDPVGRLLLHNGALDAASAADRRAAVDLDLDLTLFADSVVNLEFTTPEPPPGRAPLRLVVAEPRVCGGGRWRRPPQVEESAAALLRASEKRNLVLFTLDAAGARHFTAYGAQDEYALAVDVMARDGVVFEDVTSVASYTLPAVASLFTGCYPRYHGLVDNGAGDDPRRLAEDLPTLAELLQKAGYATVALVTNPNAGKAYGFDRGFDVYDELFLPARGLWAEGGGVPVEAVTEALAEHVAAGRLRQPFFLYVHVFQPHAPYSAPRELRRGIVDPGYQGPADGTHALIEDYRQHRRDELAAEDFAQLRDLYRANLKWADRGVEAMLRTLLGAGLLGDSLISVVGDHGEAFGEHLNLEHGDTTFAEEIEVPWILMLPRAAHMDPLRVRGPASLVDVAPTLLTLLGANRRRYRFDGIDLTPRLVATDLYDRPTFSRSFGSAPRHVVRHLGRSYHYDAYTRRELLYDLTVDPREERPLPVAGSAWAAFLRGELCAFLCGEQARPGEAAELDPEIGAQVRDIGYVGQGDDPVPAEVTATGCPLRRR